MLVPQLSFHQPRTYKPDAGIDAIAGNSNMLMTLTVRLTFLACCSLLHICW
jgi:hypothetical protein